MAASEMFFPVAVTVQLKEKILIPAPLAIRKPQSATTSNKGVKQCRTPHRHPQKATKETVAMNNNSTAQIETATYIPYSRVLQRDVRVLTIPTNRPAIPKTARHTLPSQATLQSQTTTLHTVLQTGYLAQRRRRHLPPSMRPGPPSPLTPPPRPPTPPPHSPIPPPPPLISLTPPTPRPRILRKPVPSRPSSDPCHPLRRKPSQSRLRPRPASDHLTPSRLSQPLPPTPYDMVVQLMDGGSSKPAAAASVPRKPLALRECRPAVGARAVAFGPDEVRGAVAASPRVGVFRPETFAEMGVLVGGKKGLARRVRESWVMGRSRAE